MDIEAIIRTIAAETGKTPEQVRKTEVNQLYDLFGRENVEEKPFPYLAKVMGYVANALGDGITLDEEQDHPSEEGDLTMLSTVEYSLVYVVRNKRGKTGTIRERESHEIREEVLSADETDQMWSESKYIKTVGDLLMGVKQGYDKLYAYLKEKGYEQE